MTTLTIPEQLAEQLRQIAQQEKRPIEQVLASLLDLYLHQVEPLTEMDGVFDDDLTDLSTSVRETMADYYEKRYGRSH